MDNVVASQLTTSQLTRKRRRCAVCSDWMGELPQSMTHSITHLAVLKEKHCTSPSLAFALKEGKGVCCAHFLSHPHGVFHTQLVSLSEPLSSPHIQPSSSPLQTLSSTQPLSFTNKQRTKPTRRLSLTHLEKEVITVHRTYPRRLLTHSALKNLTLLLENPHSSLNSIEEEIIMMQGMSQPSVSFSSISLLLFSLVGKYSEAQKLTYSTFKTRLRDDLDFWTDFVDIKEIDA